MVDHINMELRDESSRLMSIANTTSHNLSSSSSTFFSANQSPFFSPRSPTCFDPTQVNVPCDGGGNSIQVNGPPSSSSGIPESLPQTDTRFNLSDIPTTPAACFSSDVQRQDPVSSSTGISSSTLSSYGRSHENGYVGFHRDKQKRHWRNQGTSYAPRSDSLPLDKLRNCDVYIGLHGRKPSLLRFVSWLHAELEAQGLSCFVSDRARCWGSRKHGFAERAIDMSSFGIVILTRKSFRNPYTIEELRFFSGKKNLVPVFFDLSPEDCLVRDIVEKKGDMWEKHGGELWLLYGGLEKEWKEAVNGLSRVDEWKLVAEDGNWRDCIFKVMSLLVTKLGRRSIAEQLTNWRERVEKEEFPFPRRENFIGRKKELSDLEFILFGESGDSKRDYIEFKARPRRKNISIGRRMSNFIEDGWSSGKGKEPIMWKESEKEIEMQDAKIPPRRHQSPKPRNGGRHGRRKRSTKILYGKGIACVSGDSGIGKTELVLEFAYRHHQRYKMVLWVGGESKYIQQNFLNLWSFLGIDVGFENCIEKSKVKNFEEQEEAAISKVRKELMRNIPYLVVIDNLESEKDWWDHKHIMDLLPRFGGETHVIISTRLPRVLNLEPMQLSYLSGVEAMSLMQGSFKDYPLAEVNALRAIEEKLERLTLGLGVIGSILSELTITPSRLLDTINRMPLRDLGWSGKENNLLRRNTFLLQLFEVCFSVFDHADGSKSLATRMFQASGWFAPGSVPISLLALAARKLPEKKQGAHLWKRLLCSLTCGFVSSYTRRSEIEASSMLLRFNLARVSTKEGYIQFPGLMRLYARKSGTVRIARAMAQTVISRGTITQHSEHLWAACFLLFGFRNDPVVLELKVSELLYLVKEVVLPLAVRTFITFSRCSAAVELLHVCTNALEAADQAFVNPVEKWLDKSICWRPIQTNAQLNPYLWQQLALSRATVLETRAKLMIRGGQFDISEDLIRKALFIRTSISGEDHPDTISVRETLSKLTRLLTNFQIHTSSP